MKDGKKRGKRRRKESLVRRILREIREWIVALAAAIVIVALLHSFLFTMIRVDGDSMYPTLQDGQRLFVTVYDVKWGEVERGDIVICNFPNRGSTYFVKRVVGVPGDVVERSAGVTYVNGEALDPNGLTYQAQHDYEPYTLGEDEYFCVGDNRYGSHDSRDWNDGDASRDVGPLDRDMLVGKVKYIVWPLSDIRAAE